MLASYDRFIRRRKIQSHYPSAVDREVFRLRLDTAEPVSALVLRQRRINALTQHSQTYAARNGQMYRSGTAFGDY